MPRRQLLLMRRPEEVADWLTPNQVASRLGCKVQTLAQYRSQGIGPRYAKVAGQVLYDPAGLRHYIEERAERKERDPKIRRLMRIHREAEERVDGYLAALRAARKAAREAAAASLADAGAGTTSRELPALCIYHKADLDGVCSAAVVARARRGNVELLGTDYGEAPVPVAAAAGRWVYLVDVSYPMDEMRQLADAALSLVWLDHHETAIQAAREAGLDSIQGVREPGLAACEIAWAWFFGASWVPDAVTLLGRYDVWDHSDSRVLPFQAGAKALDLEPTSPEWDVLLGPAGSAQDHVVTELVQRGAQIREWGQKASARSAKLLAYEAVLVHGGRELRAIAANRWPSNSAWFESVYDPARHDVMVAWGWDGRRWRVSLYATKPEVDCGAIAAELGGGGHPGAGGFTTCGPWGRGHFEGCPSPAARPVCAAEERS